MKRVVVVSLWVIAAMMHAEPGRAQTAPAPAGALSHSRSALNGPAVPASSPSTAAMARQVPTDTAPKHVRTGWAALFKDTLRDFKALPRRPSTWVILSAGGGAALASKFGDRYVQQHIVGNTAANRFFSIGQWVGSSYAMVASSVGLWAVGRYVVGASEDEPKTNTWSEVGFDLMRAHILAQAVTHGTKNIVRRDRPTGECCSFPSGHAASAFAAAAVLERHLGYRGSWPFLVGATYVATSRLVDNRHFLSDVVFGAAVGTASGWTVVGSHGANEYTVQPVPVEGGMMIMVAKVPRGITAP